ncbi:MAG: hypothetical protein A2745_00445 [Candidatus Harrisonbacteria bacterium RIFCSPHIGHO2_01_FULL_44_13]|uniref:DUF5673 domain-containing protein n=1 Tax=Candidatus Harrisonbacteria bacterium RIFCSPLOWO2_01_FULL_44_18 TaxID=1798407 RepID=A0A1G1ZNQ4_9BACT|nr:MAG: hypothetical protein A2745_00445 [Candidatus Harrisonbacteria bacterium RIFCSPHIGHO2_01_FULL_44_13]OGY66135.1 MAG: hypothetical protein A3A16_02375 [Candidatus Harrisonbacteria bacterium RIFCSPLOWO2_01_FULL_44_18]
MEKEIKWSAPEFTYYHKDVSWYWVTIIAAIIILAIAFLQKNFLFAIFVIIAETMIIFWGRQSPKDIDFRLDERGLDIGGLKFYAYENLIGFTPKTPDHEKPEFTELIFRTKAKISPYLKVWINSKDNEKVKNFLLRFMPEIEHDESLTDHIAKFLRF